MEKIEFIKKTLLEEISDLDVVQYWNDYCADNSYEDSIYLYLDDLAESLCDSPVEFARRIYFGEVSSWNDNYFTFDGNVNIVSFNSLNGKNSPIDFDALAEWLEEHSYDYREIRFLIEEWEEE